DCLCASIAALKAPVHAGTARQPFGSVSLKKFCDFPLGKIGPVHVGVAFRNAPATCKRHHVEITTLNVNDAYRSIVTQTSLNNVAIRIFDPLTVVPKACRGRARD